MVAVRGRFGLGLPLVLLLVGCAEIPESAIRLDRAEMVMSDAPAPPGDGAAWREVPLPDAWPRERLARGHRAWYRIDFRLEAAPAEPFVVFLAGATLNAEIFLNGRSLGSGGRMEEPPTRNVQRPLIKVVAPGLLVAGENRLQIRLVTSARTPGLLHPIHVGPDRDFASLREATGRNTAGVQLSAILAGLLGALLLREALGRDRRPGPSGSSGLWFGLALCCVPGFYLTTLLPDIRIPSRGVEWIVGTSFHASVLCAAIGVRRAAGGPANRRERIWGAAYVALATAYALVPATSAYRVFAVWLLGSGVLIVQAYGRVVAQALRTRSRSWGVAALLLGLLGVGVVTHGVSLTLGRSFSWSGGLIAAPILLGLAAGFWTRVNRALRRAEELNATLEERVSAREAELAKNHARIQELERERVVAAERERMTREMHDGTGGLLVAALSVVRESEGESSEAGRLIEEALDDLRLTLDSLEPDAADLPTILGLIRPRLGRLTEGHGFALDWHVTDAGEGVPHEPEAFLHVVRIVQEGVANAVRHSGGGRVRVATGCSERDGSVWLEIRDDGRGGAEQADPGRGLRNLRERAELLGARLEIDSGGGGSPEGTRVRVVFAPGSRGSAEACPQN